ncbi:MAG: hypothetical protein AB4041_02365 [Microcystaceae cyanobacterium]
MTIMPDVLLKTGELIEVPEEEMLSFLQENRDLIQDRVSPRERVTLKSAEESFRQGWYEAMTENTFPLSQLWDGIDAE